MNEYESNRQRFFRAMALKWMLHLFDLGAFRESLASAIPADQPGVAYAIEIGWMQGSGPYWLTTQGISVSAELASEREDWYITMAEKVQPDA
jgi:hypothetical protein